jgi:hypothetical protein
VTVSRSDRAHVRRWPRFRFDEVVRVIDVAGWPEGSERLLGREGIVYMITPDREGRGWIIGVRFGPVESGTHWDGEDLWEHQLESTGFLDADGERAPLRAEEHADSFSELLTGIFVPITQEPVGFANSSERTRTGATSESSASSRDSA